MARFRLEVELENNGFIEITSQNVKYWKTEGLPTYKGSIDGLEANYPEIVAELVDSKIITKL